MTKPKLLIVMALAALPPPGTVPHAVAQTSPVAQAATPNPPTRYVPRRIEIHPRPLLYRRCTDWYELQNRPSGTVLFPQMRCWWVRG